MHKATIDMVGLFILKFWNLPFRTFWVYP